MINLPKQLVYQPRRDIADYTTGNELNRALYNALKSIRHPSFFQRMMGVPALSDEDILRIFNDAYYLCIVICNDHNTSLLKNSFKDCFSAYTRQVVEVVLSLQRNSNGLADLYLRKYGALDFGNPLSEVLLSFLSRDITFDMKFAILLPDPRTLEMDWEEETRSFDKDIIVGILDLWKDTGDKLEVCRKIYDAFCESPRRDMPSVSADFPFFENLMRPWVNEIGIRKWRQELERTGSLDWPDDVPAHFGMEETQEEVRPAAAHDEAPAETHTGVKRDEEESIFDEKKMEQDGTGKEAETARFLKFLEEHWAEPRAVVNSSKKHFVNVAFVAFCKQWQDLQWLAKPLNCYACHRFLRDACKLEIAVDEHTHGEKLRKMLTRREKEISMKVLTEIEPLVCGMFGVLKEEIKTRARMGHTDESV